MKRTYWYIIAIYLFLQIGGAILTVLLSKLYGFDNISTVIYVNIVGFLIVAIIMLYMLRQDLREEKTAHPLSFGRLIGWVALGLFMAWGAEMIAAVIEMTIFGVEPDSTNTQMIVEISRMKPIFILVPALIGPILEEIVFRKVLFGTFYKKFNFVISALLSSLIFAAAHNEFTHILVYAAMGFVFAYLYVKTKRIIVPILVHMALNSIAILGQMFIDIEKLEKMQEQMMLIFSQI